MLKITTALGAEFDVYWCAVSTIDYSLRFEIANASMSDVLMTFCNPDETASITYVFDETSTAFDGFTKFKGVNLNPSGSIVVALMKEGTT